MNERLPLPVGAEPVEQARLCGRRPEGPVIVSYVGDTPWDAHHVHCESGKRYRWGWSENLELAIVVRPGVDAMDAFRGCYWPADSQHLTTVIDIEGRKVSHIVQMLPRPRLWHLLDVSGYFPEESYANHP